MRASLTAERAARPALDERVVRDIERRLIGRMIEAGFVLPYVVAREVTPEMILLSLDEPDEQRRAWEHQGIDSIDRRDIERRLIERMLAAGKLTIEPRLYRPAAAHSWDSDREDSSRVYMAESVMEWLDWLDVEAPRS